MRWRATAAIVGAVGLGMGLAFLYRSSGESRTDPRASTPLRTSVETKPPSSPPSNQVERTRPETHSPLLAPHGVVLVMSRNAGMPVAGAAILLRDTATDQVHALGETSSEGIMTIPPNLVARVEDGDLLASHVRHGFAKEAVLPGKLFYVLEVDEAARIVLKVLHRGRQVMGARAKVFEQFPSNVWKGTGKTHAGESGLITIPEIVPGMVKVHVRADGFQSQTVDLVLSPGEEREVSCELSPSRVLTLRVSNSTGQSVIGAAVKVEQPNRFFQFSQSAKTDRHGVVQFDGLANERVTTIEIEHVDYEIFRRGFDSHPSATESEIMKVELEESGSLRLRLEDERGQAITGNVFVRCTDEPVSRGSFFGPIAVSGEGEAWVRHIPAGVPLVVTAERGGSWLARAERIVLARGEERSLLLRTPAMTRFDIQVTAPHRLRHGYVFLRSLGIFDLKNQAFGLTAQLDETGRCSAMVPTGDYRLELELWDGTKAESEFTVDGQLDVFTVDIEENERITGHVVDQHRVPYRGRGICLESGNQWRAAQLDIQGGFEFCGLPSEPVRIYLVDPTLGVYLVSPSIQIGGAPTQIVVPRSYIRGQTVDFESGEPLAAVIQFTRRDEDRMTQGLVGHGRRRTVTGSEDGTFQVLAFAGTFEINAYTSDRRGVPKYVVHSGSEVTEHLLLHTFRPTEVVLGRLGKSLQADRISLEIQGGGGSCQMDLPIVDGEIRDAVPAGSASYDLLAGGNVVYRGRSVICHAEENILAQ